MVPLWQQFKEEFAESSPVELVDGKDILMTFFINVDKVIEHNSRSDKTYTKGINKFSAMTWEEFQDHFHLVENQKNAE